MRRLRLARAAVAISLAASAGSARAGDPGRDRVPAAISVASGSIQTVYFAGRRIPVRIVRGADAAGRLRLRVETTTFGDGTAKRVTILRGVIDRMPTAGARPAKPGVLAVGGGGRSRGSSSADLFGLSNDEEFNRIAEAVHGIESRYGTDARMWRLDNLDGPQGPMQVSAAAAVDVGGGDRFDVYENLLLGRAYLARLLWKYDSWPDALAAYNWGPGNVDQWIARGRNAAQLPAETTRYIALVMRRASLGSIAGTVQQRIPKP